MYARKKGFLLSVFTSGMLLNHDIISFFRKYPPFCVEVTLNAATRQGFRKVTGFRSGLHAVLTGLKAMQQEGIPFKIKTQVTMDNLSEIPAIASIVREFGKELRLGYVLFPMLDGNLLPCQLRLSPAQIKQLLRRYPALTPDATGLSHVSQTRQDMLACSSDQHVLRVDPSGNLLICTAFRRISLNMLDHSVDECRRFFLSGQKELCGRPAECRGCRQQAFCECCSGKALSETGGKLVKLAYYCSLARRMAELCQ